MTPSGPRADIAVFAKAPVSGAVKTRLAGLLGPDAAASLHAALVRHTLATAVQSRIGAVALWCAPDARHPFFARCGEQFAARLHEQGEGDLGARMARAFARASGPLLLVGSDCPGFTTAHLEEAARALATHDAVFVPAEDGGYVVVGLARPVRGIFDGVAWGSAAVMAQTRERLAAAGARWRELPALWDVDRPEDFARLQRDGLLAEVLS